MAPSAASRSGSGLQLLSARRGNPVVENHADERAAGVNRPVTAVERLMLCGSIGYNENPVGSSTSPFPLALMSRIAIATPQDAVPIDRKRMREVARAVLDGEEKAEAEVSLAFVDNPTIQRLNARYLQHDEPTDVLSFPLSDPSA